jgi:hypothetical protein
VNNNIADNQQKAVEEMIMEIARQVPGIGNATAGAIAADFDGDLQAFLSADAVRLSKLQKSNGRQQMSGDIVAALIEAKSQIPNNLSIQETWVFYLGRKFLKTQLEMVSKLNFQDFDINPLLAKALSLDTPRKVIAFNVYQTITRSIVTSWGYTVQDLAKNVGVCEENDYKGSVGNNFDLVKRLSNFDYYIQVKSGPNDMNVGMVTSLNREIAGLERSKPGSKAILGMTYGTRSRISKQILGNLLGGSDRMKVGRELWDFLSERKDFHKDLFRLLDDASRGLLNNSFIELIEAKIKELEDYWIQNNMGKSLDDVLETFI